jgi:intracellular multiplication protein IcmT
LFFNYLTEAVMGAAEDTQVERANWHWRNSMRPPRFFNLDARAAIPFLILLVYFRPLSLLVTIIITSVFKYLEHKGLTFNASLRALRVWLLGTDRPAWLPYRHRHNVDYV